MRYILTILLFAFTFNAMAVCEYSLHPNGCVLEIKCDSGSVVSSLDLGSITWVEYSDDDINLKDYSGNRFSADIDNINGFATTALLIEYIKTQRMLCRTSESGTPQNLIQINDSSFYITETNDTIIIQGLGGGGSPQNLVQLTDSTFVISETNDTILINKQFLLLGATSPNSRRIVISDGNYVDININDLDADSTNEIQALSISNDTIYLEDGGFVVLANQLAILMSYDSLVSLRDNNSLIVGNNYVIPYQAVWKLQYTDSIGDGTGGDEVVMTSPHIEHFIITATSDSSLSSFVRSVELPNHTIHYELDNSLNWKDIPANHNGVVYRRYDERGNKVPFDFVNITQRWWLDTVTNQYSIARKIDAMDESLYKDRHALSPFSERTTWEGRGSPDNNYSMSKVSIRAMGTLEAISVSGSAGSDTVYYEPYGKYGYNYVNEFLPIGKDFAGLGTIIDTVDGENAFILSNNLPINLPEDLPPSFQNTLISFSSGSAAVNRFETLSNSYFGGLFYDNAVHLILNTTILESFEFNIGNNFSGAKLLSAERNQVGNIIGLTGVGGNYFKFKDVQAKKISDTKLAGSVQYVSFLPDIENDTIGISITGDNYTVLSRYLTSEDMNYTYSLPLSNGMFPLSVNGEVADVLGNIDLDSLISVDSTSLGSPSEGHIKYCIDCTNDDATTGSVVVGNGTIWRKLKFQ